MPPPKRSPKEAASGSHFPGSPNFPPSWVSTSWRRPPPAPTRPGRSHRPAEDERSGHYLARIGHSGCFHLRPEWALRSGLWLHRSSQNQQEPGAGCPEFRPRHWRHLHLRRVPGLIGLLILPVFCCRPSPELNDKARTINCLTNMKQLSTAVSAYARDNNNHLPAAATWSDSVSNYVSSTNFFHCPADSHPGCSYAFNQKLGSDRIFNKSIPPPSCSLKAALAGMVRAARK